MYDVTDDDREYLVMLLDRRLTELLHELHHTTTHRFKEGLREEIDHAERLKAKLGAGVHA